jgi:hypothetical protein
MKFSQFTFGQITLRQKFGLIGKGRQTGGLVGRKATTGVLTWAKIMGCL